MRKIVQKMLRSTCFVLWGCASWITGSSQVSSYSFSQSSGTFTPISGGTVLGTATNDDNNFTSLPIGFTFTYNGTGYTNFSVNANGFIALGTTVTNSYAAISGGTTNNIIAALNTDLQGNTSTGQLSYLTTGTAPNRTLVVEWLNYRYWAATGDNFNFQIRLNETSNTIEVVYGSFTKNASNRTVQVGLRGSTNADYNNRTSTTDWSATTAGGANNATVALQTAVLPASGLTFTWSPPLPCSGTPVAGTASSSVANACSGTNFNLVLSGSTTGTGITIQWQSSPDGISYTNISGGTTATYATSQTDTTYYQAIVTCTASGLSATSNAIQVNMDNFLNCYCTSSATSTFDDDIGQVTLGTLANPATTPSPLTNNPSATNTYSDFTSLTPVDLERGLSYSASITQINQGGFYGCGTAMFIDFDQNGIFDASERVLSGQTATTNPVTGTVSIPVTAILGITKMRVVLNEGATGSSMSSCGTYTWGETEDYYVNILPEPPPCSGTPVTGTASSSVASVCESVSFNLSLSGHDTGTDITYQWYSSTDGISYTLISGATTTTYSASQTDTSWYFAVVTCTTSGLFDSTNIVQVNMENFLNCYCTSNATSNADDDIGQVTLGNYANPAIAPSPLTNNATATNTYSDFTSTVTPFDLNRGLSYPASITQINQYGFYGCGAAMFIDYDQNGIFDPAERVISGQTSASNPVTGTFAVPTTAALGLTRMRVVLNEGATGSTMSSCGTYTWGETEDYYVNILPAPDTNLVVVSIDNISSGCGLGITPVDITLQSQGSDTLFAGTTIYINYSDGTTTINDTITLTSSIPFGGTLNYTFSSNADFSNSGTYNVMVWATLANDTIQTDDTVSMTINSILTVNTFPYFEDFENGKGGWESYGTNSTWDFGTPMKTTITGAASGVNAWANGGLTSGTNYNNNEQSYVLSPCFDFTTLPANPWIAMKIWWNAENNWDGAVVQMSRDGGATWVRIGQYNATTLGWPYFWYNDATINGNPGGQAQGWTNATGQSNGYIQVSHPLDTTGFGDATSVQFRVAFGSDGSVTYEGVAFDDFALGSVPVITLDDTTACGTFTYVSGYTNGTFDWAVNDVTTGTTTATASTPDLTLTNPTYADSFAVVVLTYTDEYGFSDRDTATIGIYPAPIFSLGADTAICYNQSITLHTDTSSRYTYLWSTGATTDSIIVNMDGLYSATVTDTISGCEITDDIYVYITPAVDLPIASVSCSNDSAMIDAGADYSTYNWSTSETTQQIMVTTTGTYSVTVTDSIGCTSSDNISVTVNPSPNVFIGPDDTICVTQNIILDAGSGFDVYLWSTNATTQTIMVSGSSIGVGTHDYIVTVSNSFGCQEDDTLTLVVDACLGVDEYNTPEITIAPNPTNGVFNLSLQRLSGRTELMIYSFDGKMVYSEVIRDASGTNRIIDLTEEPAGMYFIRLSDGDRSWTEKIIKL